MSVKHWKTARSHFQAMLLVALLALSGCALFEQDVEPPPRSNEPIEIPEGFSVVAADIEIALGTPAPPETPPPPPDAAVPANPPHPGPPPDAAVLPNPPHP